MQRFVSLAVALLLGMSQASLMLNEYKGTPLIFSPAAASSETTTTTTAAASGSNSTAPASTSGTTSTAPAASSGTTSTVPAASSGTTSTTPAAASGSSSTASNSSTGNNSTSAKFQATVQDVSDDLKRLNCILYDELTVFNIQGLESNVSSSYGNYVLSFCRPVSLNNQTGYVFENNGAIVDSSALPSNIQTVTQEADTDPATHLTFDQVSKIKYNSTLNYTVSYEVFCDPTVSTVNISVAGPEYNPKVSLTHKSGCPLFQATAITAWLSTHGWVLAILLIAFGAVTTFFGGKYIPWVIAIVAGFLVFFIVLLLASVTGGLNALNSGGSPTGGSIALAVFVFLLAFGLAFLAGWFIYKIERIGITILGAAAGFLGGFLLYTFVFIQWAQSSVLLGALAVIGAVTLGWFTYRYQRLLVVYLSAFIGSYSFVRGISIFGGHYPSEVTLYGQISSGTYTGLEWQFYLYLVSIFILGAIGAGFQIRRGYNTFEEDGEFRKA